MGDEFLGGLQEEGGVHVGGVGEHGFRLAEEAGGLVLGLRVAGGGDGQLHHEGGVIGVIEDRLFEQQTGGAELVVGDEFVGEFHKLIRAAAADLEKLGGVAPRLAVHALLAVKLGEGLVGERLAGIDIEHLFQDGDTLFVLFRGKQEDAEAHLEIERGRDGRDVLAEDGDGLFHIPRLAEVIAGGTGDG